MPLLVYLSLYLSDIAFVVQCHWRTKSTLRPGSGVYSIRVVCMGDAYVHVARIKGMREYMQDHVEDYSPDFPMSMT